MSNNVKPGDLAMNVSPQNFGKQCRVLERSDRAEKQFPEMGVIWEVETLEPWNFIWSIGGFNGDPQRGEAGEQMAAIDSDLRPIDPPAEPEEIKTVVDIGVTA